MSPFPHPRAWHEPPKWPICVRNGCGPLNSRLNSRFRRWSPRVIGPGAESWPFGRHECQRLG